MKDLFGNKIEQKTGRLKNGRHAAITEIKVEDTYRRAYGVYQLCQCMMKRPEPGMSYHIITGGQVDLLAHLQWLMLHWPKITRVFVSAWAIGAVDIQICKQLLEKGVIGEMELLLGELFPSRYTAELAKLTEMQESGLLKRVYISAIHSKILLVEAEDGTKIVVESSANCNMNPRIEQACITVSGKLFDFYDVYLHDVLAEEEAKFVVKNVVELSKEDDDEISADERSALLRED